MGETKDTVQKEEKSGLGKKNNINTHSFSSTFTFNGFVRNVREKKTAVKNKSRLVSSQQPHQSHGVG